MREHSGKPNNGVIILSGGMDSATLLYEILGEGYSMRALTFNYGQKHRKEIECAKNICNKLEISHKVLDFPLLCELAPSSLTRADQEIPSGHYTDDTMKLTVVPNRNMVMLSLAASYAIGIGADSLFYGAHWGDHTIYPDCRPAFISAMQTAFHLCDWKDLRLQVPYLLLSKKDIVTRGMKLSVPYELTWTCYRGGVVSCGTCGSCTERLEAFRDAGFADPLQYE